MPTIIMDGLKRTHRQTMEYFNLPSEHLEKSYAPGKWTVKQILHHLTDAETVMYDRLRRVISEPRQVIWAFDQEAWAKHLNYELIPLNLSAATYDAVREQVIYLAQNFYLSHGYKEFVHSETGVRTLKDEFEKIVWHNEGHLNQIERALGKF